MNTFFFLFYTSIMAALAVLVALWSLGMGNGINTDFIL